VCVADEIVEYHYGSPNCAPGTMVGNVTVPANVCYINPRNYYGHSVTLGCALNVDEIPVTGNFVGQLFYNDSATCNGDAGPDSFLAFSSSYCFTSQDNNATSLKFGCSESNTGPQVKQFDNTVCAEDTHTYTTHFNPYCHEYTTPPNGLSNLTMTGYDQYICIAQNTSQVYDDDYSNDDYEFNYEYSYILIGNEACFDSSDDTVAVVGFENNICAPYITGLFAIHQCNGKISLLLHIHHCF